MRGLQGWSLTSVRHGLVLVLWLVSQCDAGEDFPPAGVVELQGREAVETLKAAARSVGEAYEAILTWEAEGRLRERSPLRAIRVPPELAPEIAPEPGATTVELPGRYAMDRWVKIQFRLDRNSGQHFSSYESIPPARFLNVETGVELELDPGISQWNLVDRDLLYVKRPLEQVGELRGFPETTAPGRRFTGLIELRDASSREQRTRNGSPEFDPELLFYRGGMRIDELLRRHASRRENDADAVRVYRDSKSERLYLIALFKLRREREFEMPHRMILSVQENYLPLEISNFLGEREFDRAAWEYTVIDGVRVPRRFEDIQWSEAGEEQLHVDLELTTMQVNQSINPDHFALSALKPEDGDRLFDRTKNALSIFQEGQPVPLESPLPGRVPEMQILLWINGLLLSGILTWLLARHLIRTAK